MDVLLIRHRLISAKVQSDTELIINVQHKVRAFVRAEATSRYRPMKLNPELSPEKRTDDSAKPQASQHWSKGFFSASERGVGWKKMRDLNGPTEKA